MLREKRTAGSKQLDELNHKLDELTETLNRCEALLRVKEVSGVLVRIVGLIDCSCQMIS